MKKTLILVFAVVALSSAKAQIQFGVKAGVNLANLTVSDKTDGESFKANTSFNAGILASIPLGGPLRLQPEVMYSAQGSKATDTFSTSTSTLNYGYINVPVLIKYQSAMGLFAETGPQIGFLIAAKAKADGQSLDIKSEIKSTDFSWAFGVGYKIPVINLGIDLRYNLGLTNTLSSSGSSGTSSTAKNSVFQFGLFYLFGFGNH
jgi:hypothetical protein